MTRDNETPKIERGSAFIVRALRHRNYRLFVVGQGISLIGTWLTRVATSWLVYRLSHSAFVLGAVGFAGQIPTFILAPFAGVLVDRWNRHRVLLATQVLAMFQSAALAVLTLTGTITITHVVFLSIVQGLINAFDMPVRQSFVVQMIEDRADLSNAIALNSSMVNLARLIGPSFAGILIATTGEGGCFTVDAISYLAVIVCLLLMNVRMVPAHKSGKHILHELREGFHYVARFAPIRSILLLLALVSLMGMPYMVLLPVVAVDQLHGGPNVLGWLTAASGLGALGGALYLASRKSVLGLGKVIPFSACIFGIGLIAFSRSHWLWLSLLLMFVTGIGMMVQMASSNTLLQTIVDEDKRGRVMSFYTMAFVGMAPFGSLLAGSLAERIGAADTFLIGGIACVCGGALFLNALPAMRYQLKPTYVRMGILSDDGSRAGQAVSAQED